MIEIFAAAGPSGQSPAGAADEQYAGRQLGAAAITVAVFVAVVVLRRYWFASSAGTGVRGSLYFALWPWAPEPKTDKPEAGKYKGLLIGTDNRVSTGKTTAFIWTLVVAYIILAMALIFGTQREQYSTLIGSISPLYLVLLGGPLAAAVLAKGIVAGSVQDKTAQRPAAEKPHVADVFSDDDGNTDLVDTQYLVFNALVAIIVLVQFAHAPGLGAPQIPDFLAGLTGASAATYVANKAVGTGNDAPAIDQLVPSRGRPGAKVALYGRNLRVQGDPPNATVTVTVGQNAAKYPPESPTKLTFRIPRNAVSNSVATPVTVVTDLGLVTSDGKTITVVPDEITVVPVNAAALAEGGRLTLIGTGFFDAAAVDMNGTLVKDHELGPDDRARVYLTPEQPASVEESQRQLCEPAPGTEQSDSTITVTVPVGLAARSQNGKFTLGVERGLVRADINPPIVLEVAAA